ncbi:MAG: Gfo/Idh/MocA family protein [Candidatus Hodarchaeales archaeon]|jgi:predicted dehydrogenase
MNKIRWGILGTARIANRMATAIQSSDKGELTAIGSRKKEKADSFASKFDISEKYNNYQDLVESDSVDAIYIPLPNHLHKKWTVEAAQNKKHVLCEKPFSLNANEAQNMFSAGEKNEVVVMEGFMYRFNPVVSKIKDILDQNIIGNVQYVNFCFSHSITNYLNEKDNYRYYRDQGGGSLLDLGVYGINFFNFLFGFKSTKILQALSYQKSKKETDSTYMTTLQYNNKIICQLTSGFDFFGNYLIISGTEGLIEVNQLTSDGKKAIIIRSNKNIIISEKEIPEFDHFKAQINHFNDSIIKNKKVLISQEETLATIFIIDQLREKEEIILLN